MGPLRCSFSPSVPAASAARRVRRFLTMRKRVSASRRPGAKLGGLRHADPAVVDREDRRRVLELGGELLDHCCLLLSVHFAFGLARLANKKTRTQAGQSGRSSDRVTLAHLRRTSGPGSRRRSWAAIGSEQCRGSAAASKRDGQLDLVTRALQTERLGDDAALNLRGRCMGAARSLRTGRPSASSSSDGARS